VQRLINSHFGNKDRVRISIPTETTDDDVTAADYVRESAVRIRDLEAKLAALDWKPITHGNMPKEGDEVFRKRQDWITVDAVVPDDTSYEEWIKRLKYTHFRPINPPKEQTS
jgi:hypothetical protein